MKLFKSKEQIEEIKSIPFNHRIDINTALTLSSIQINYSVTRTKPYWVSVEYKEHPEQWDDKDNQKRRIELSADDWPSLVDKVIGHFNGSVQE